jgi:hypothetical protein
MTGLAQPDDRDRAAALDAIAASLGLPVAPEWREAIIFHMKLVGEAARLVEDFPLSDEAEAAPVFVP